MDLPWLGLPMGFQESRWVQLWWGHQWLDWLCWALLWLGLPMGFPE